MKIIKYQATEEKTILTALITHDQILGRIHEHAGHGPLFKSKWANLVSKWCFDYYLKFRKAPRAVIQQIFVKYSQQEGDESAVEIIDKFLATLSRSYSALAEEMNIEYVIDLAANYFRKLRLEKMAEGIETALERHDLDGAQECYDEFEPVSFGKDAWSNPFCKSEVLETLGAAQSESVIEMPGAMGKFLSPALERNGFIAFVGPEKRGKSFWLTEMVWRALRQRRRVLYYSLGDMSKAQVNFRLYKRAAQRPMFTKTLTLPTGIKVGGKDEGGRPAASIETFTREFPGLSVSSIKRAIVKLSTVTALKQLRLKLQCAGSSVISASQIEQDIQNFSKDGWVPDVVVIDYADELAPEPSSAKLDYRHQVNETWRTIRRITLDYHCLAITATQAAARSYDAWVITKKDFSDDKRKNAHVTGMIGINQTAGEKQSGLYRLNWVLLRDGAWSEMQCLWTAGNLAVACPCIKSSL